MTKPRRGPLDPSEERAWRSFARALVVLPRTLEAELVAAHRLTMTEYFVLVHLSEAPEGQMRMSVLAERGAVSTSAMSRVIDHLVADNLVVRRRCPSDLRGWNAVLTPAGLRRLEEAYPTHLAGVRRHLLDHLDGFDLDALAGALNQIAGESAPPGAI